MESDPGHGDATPRVERAVGPFDEAEAALARREAFDAQAWEAALADKTALAPGAGAVGARARRGDAAPGAPRERGSHLRRRRRARRSEPASGGNPDPQGSFCFIDAFVAVTADEEFRAATLVLRVERDKIGPMVTETLRLFAGTRTRRATAGSLRRALLRRLVRLGANRGSGDLSPSWASTRTRSSCTP
jgi:hypothetical protein